MPLPASCTALHTFSLFHQHFALVVCITQHVIHCTKRKRRKPLRIWRCTLVYMRNEARRLKEKGHGEGGWAKMRALYDVLCCCCVLELEKINLRRPTTQACAVPFLCSSTLGGLCRNSRLLLYFAGAGNTAFGRRRPSPLRVGRQRPAIKRGPFLLDLDRGHATQTTPSLSCDFT